jgi:hypothetical protein
MQLPEEVVREDWAAMSPLQQRAYFGRNGFLVIPGALSDRQLESVRHAIVRRRPHASPRAQARAFRSIPAFWSTFDNDKILAVVRTLLGVDLRFFKGDYVAKHPAPGAAGRTALHVDHGIGEQFGDACNTSASWLNVAVYLTDMSRAHGPFSVVPGSHHYHHLVPGTSMEELHDEARLLLASAGDAVVFYRTTVHAGGLNVSPDVQHILFCSYRAAWARPTARVAEWPLAVRLRASPSQRALLRGLNDAGYYRMDERRLGSEAAALARRVGRRIRALVAAP